MINPDFGQATHLEAENTTVLSSTGQILVVSLYGLVDRSELLQVPPPFLDVSGSE